MALRVSKTEAMKLAKGKTTIQLKRAKPTTSRKKPQQRRVDHADLFEKYLKLLAPDLRPYTRDEYKHAVALGTVDWSRPVREYLFNEPFSEHRADYAWVLFKLIIEIDGGQYTSGGGRHNQDSDRHKTNLACLLGYRRLVFSSEMLQADPRGCIAITRAAINSHAGGDITRDLEYVVQAARAAAGTETAHKATRKRR